MVACRHHRPCWHHRRLSGRAEACGPPWCRTTLRKGTPCRNASSFFECFPYVCPEPVLAKDHFQYKRAQKHAFPYHVFVPPRAMLRTVTCSHCHACPEPSCPGACRIHTQYINTFHRGNTQRKNHQPAQKIFRISNETDAALSENKCSGYVALGAPTRSFRISPRSGHSMSKFDVLP